MCEEVCGSSDINLFPPSHLFGFPACANRSGISNSYADLCLSLKKVVLWQQLVREPCLQLLCRIGNEEGGVLTLPESDNGKEIVVAERRPALLLAA